MVGGRKKNNTGWEEKGTERAESVSFKSTVCYAMGRPPMAKGRGMAFSFSVFAYWKKEY